jgi:hypothetical protein
MELLGAEAAGRPAFGRVATGGRTVTRVFACGVEGAGRDAAEIKSTVLAFADRVAELSSSNDCLISANRFS